MNKLENDFTQGSIGGHLLRFSIPFLMSNLLQALYNVADMLIVGQFHGQNTVAGVNMGGQITNLVVMLVSGLTVGGTVLVAQYYGARREKDVQETIGTLFSTLAIAGVALSLVMLLFSDNMLRLLKTPEEAFSEARAYLDISLLGTVFIFGYNAISSIQRGLGDSKRPLIFVAIACSVNVVLDLLFVGAFGMGAAGAAWATILSQGLSMLLAAVYLMRSRFIFDFKPSSFRIHMDKVRLLIKLGLPSSVQSVVTNFSFLLMTTLVNGFGVSATAAVGIAGKFNSFGILPAVAMSSAISSMVAQNMGAGYHDRAQKIMWSGARIALAFGAFVFLIAQLFPVAILNMFGVEDNTVSMGVEYMRAFSWDYLVVSLLFCINGLINGAGYTTYSLITSMVSAIGLRVPVAWFMSSTSLGLAGVGMAAPIASGGALIIAMIFYMSGKWKKNRTGIARTASEKAT